MTMETKEVLVKARKLIEDAPDIARKVFVHNNCYCTVGAILKVLTPTVGINIDTNYNNSFGAALNRNQNNLAFSKICNSFGVSEICDIFDINDNSTKQEVLGYFDKAIESLEK